MVAWRVLPEPSRAQPSPAPPPRSASFRSAAALGLFAILAVAHTWPIAASPGHLGRNSQADTKLNQWTMAWVAHQVTHDPVHLYDANIFYPERHTLAFSENLFVQAMMGAPLAWAGGSPVLVYNVVLIAGFALTGWTTALVMQRWTGSWLAGLLSGSLMAFNAMTLTRLSHIQMLHLEFFPLALMAFDQLLASPGFRPAARTALFFVLQALTSIYFLVFTFFAFLAAAIVRAGEWGRRWMPALGWSLVSACLALAALLPFLWPYLEARREQAMFVRTLVEVGRFSASLTDYLATGGTLHNRLWSGRFFRSDGLFPGVIGLVLTGYALATGVAFADRRARMALGFGLLAFLLSFGPALSLYRGVYAVFPPMAAIRGAARWGQLVLAAVALLAGFGLVELRRRLRPSLAVPACLVLIAIVNLEAWRAPFQFIPEDRWEGVPPVFKALNTPEPEVVIVFPFYPPQRIFMNARYMLVSTAFWKPLVNGYSGYMPTRYITHTQNLGGFPDDRSVRYLEELGVTRVLVDSRNVDPGALARLPQFPELSLIGSDGNLRIYALRR